MMYILATIVCGLTFAGVISYVSYDAIRIYKEICEEEKRA